MERKTLVHLPVLAKQSVDALLTTKDGVYVDGTFGRGGHTRLILEKLSPNARLIAFDRDPQAVLAAKEIKDPRFQIIHSPFANMKDCLKQIGIEKVDGIFLDIGVSSPQIDDPERGFSFRFDGPLDMRMDTSQGLTAQQWLAQAKESEISSVIKEFGEERFASKIAKAIVAERQKKPIVTTGQLASLIASVVPKNSKDKAQHPATRTFQAIRIFINGELDQLREALEEAGSLLNEGAVLAVISFHSLEDRIVKRFFEHCFDRARSIDSRLPLLPSQLPQPLFEKAKRVLPDEQEKEENPRARSSILRYAKRTAEVWPDKGVQI